LATGGGTTGFITGVRGCGGRIVAEVLLRGVPKNTFGTTFLIGVTQLHFLVLAF
jgi:hypothetical protein